MHHDNEKQNILKNAFRFDLLTFYTNETCFQNSKTGLHDIAGILLKVS
jgi:hypothetical protein